MEIFITIIILGFALYSLYKSLKKSTKGGCSSCSSNCHSKANCPSMKENGSSQIKIVK